MANTSIRAATSLATTASTAANVARGAILGAVGARGTGAVGARGTGQNARTSASGTGSGTSGTGSGTSGAETFTNYPYEIGPLNIQELMKLLTLLLPYFIVFMFIMISIINSNIKGFIYFFGLIFIYVMIKFFQRSIPNNQKEHICRIFDSYHYVHPSFISALYAYTIVYMITPMAMYNVFNIPLIIILLVFSVIDLIVRYKSGCVGWMPIMIGSIIGAGVAVGWSSVLSSTGNSSLLYYDDLVSNKQSCSRKSNEQFKCAVYKNGELLNTLNSNSNLSSS